eukprot:4901980-Pyramimonas_sp.AAC.1
MGPKSWRRGESISMLTSLRLVLHRSACCEGKSNRQAPELGDPSRRSNDTTALETHQLVRSQVAAAERDQEEDRICKKPRSASPQATPAQKASGQPREGPHTVRVRLESTKGIEGVTQRAPEGTRGTMT